MLSTSSAPALCSTFANSCGDMRVRNKYNAILTLMVVKEQTFIIGKESIRIGESSVHILSGSCS